MKISFYSIKWLGNPLSINPWIVARADGSLGTRFLTLLGAEVSDSGNVKNEFIITSRV